MEEYNNEEFYENVYDVPEEDFNADEQVIEPVKENTQDEELSEVQNEQKEEDSKISIKDITELIKAINPESTEDKPKEEIPVEEDPVEDKPVEEAPVEEEVKKEIVTNDYTEILNDIQREVSSGNADSQDAQQYIIDYIDNHSVYTSIDSISIDTLLLVLIFSALLMNILVNLIRRLF